MIPQQRGNTRILCERASPPSLPTDTPTVTHTTIKEYESVLALNALAEWSGLGRYCGTRVNADSVADRFNSRLQGQRATNCD